MSLAKVLKNVMTNSSPSQVTATLKSSFRVITEGEYLQEMRDLDHYNVLKRNVEALTAEKNRIDTLTDDVAENSGRQQILADVSYDPTNPTAAVENNLLQRLRAIREQFKNATEAFNEDLIKLEEKLRLKQHERVNTLLAGDLVGMTNYYNNIPNTQGVYIEGANKGFLIGFIAYLELRNNAIQQRLTIMNGPQNPDELQLRVQLTANYWSNPATLESELNLFIAETAQRETLMTGSYTDLRNIASAMNYGVLLNNMPAADTDEARKLTNNDVVALIDAVKSKQQANTVSSGLLGQALSDYTTEFGQVATDKDVSSAGDAQAVQLKKTQRLAAQTLIKNTMLSFNLRPRL
jgi:hypothetical protein